MTPRLTLNRAAMLCGLAAALLVGTEPSAQTASAFNRQPPTAATDIRLAIQGTVKDLTRDALGRILYCTAEGEVGRIEFGGNGRTVLATSKTAFFPNELRALAETPSGDIAVLDVHGSVRVLQGGTIPAVLTYSDLYMIGDATDLIVDATGNFLIASHSPSSGQRAVNWIQGNGQRWAYYLVKHQPVQLAHDPTTGGILLSDEGGGGHLRLVEAGSTVRAISDLDTSTNPGLDAAEDDGDMAVTLTGTVYWIAGGTVYAHQRSSGTTSVLGSGYGQLRGVVIADSSGRMPSASGQSLYLAEDGNPTRLREIPNVGLPAPVLANDQGTVPGRGIPVNVIFGFQAFDIAPDNAGNLIVSGAQWGSTFHVKRITLGSPPTISNVASNANGLTGVIEGVSVAPDDSIYALTREGVIHRITEGPLSVTTVFTDPFDQITAGKDLAMDLNGSLYVATRESWDFGKLLSVSGGSATLLKATEESRGLAANPGGGMLFSQWHNSGFNGSVDLFHFADSSIEVLPGFVTMNYTNDSVWGDGDICVDAFGTIYTVSEDDWSLVRYDANQDGFVRIGSSYLNHPSGLAIAPSTPGANSATGWSLYVSEFDFLWEKPNVQAPAPLLVDSSLGLRVDRTVASTPHPRFGKPQALAPLPGASGTMGGLIGTASGWVLSFDARTGEALPIWGPEDGLRGTLVALAPRPGGHVLALNKEGEVFALSGGQVRRLPIAPARTAAALRRLEAAPQRTLRLYDPLAGNDEWYALDGWVLWRVDSTR